MSLPPPRRVSHRDTVPKKRRPLALLPALLLRVIPLLALLVFLRLDALPAAPFSQEALARQALLLSDAAIAQQALMQARAYRPYDAELIAAYAEASLRAADYEATLQALAELEAMRPLSPREIGLRGSAHGGLAQFSAARADWEAAWAGGGIDPQALAELSSLYVASGQWEAAREALTALDAVSSDPALIWQLAQIEALEDRRAAPASLARLEGDLRYGVPAARLGEIVGDESLQGDAYYLRLGRLLLNQGATSLARDAFDRGWQINPANAEALAYRAYLDQRGGQAALADSQQALALGPDQPVVHYLAGLVWSLNGELYEARAAYLRASALDPANPAFAVEIANTYRASADLDLAEVWLLRAAQIARGSASEREFQLLLAQFYVDAGYHVEDRGLPLAEALVERDPADARGYDALGWALLLTGEVERAAETLDQALLLDPQLARAHFHRGRVYETQANLERALWHYQQAASLEPASPHGQAAQEAINRLEGR